MKREACGQLVAMLFSSYPNSTLEKRHVEAYISALSDLPAEAAGKAVDRIRRTSKFLPSVSEIREAASDVVLGPKRSGEEAYAVVLEAVRRFGRYETPGFTDPHIQRAIGVWGTWVDLCNSPEDDPGGRARFIELYEQQSGRERADIVSGIPLPAARPRGEFILPADKPGLKRRK